MPTIRLRHNRALSLTRAGRAAVTVAFLLCGWAVITSGLSPAHAVSSSGAAAVVKPTGDPGAGAPLTSGGSATPFSLKLPADSACTGDGVAGYHVQSYMVPASVDPSTLTYGELGPDPTGVGASFRQPLFKPNTDAYVNVGPNAGDGKVISIPSFDLHTFAIADLPAGAYKLGLACTKPAPNASQIDKFWVGDMTILASGTDPKGFTWTAAAAVTTTTTTGVTGSSTSTTAGTGSTTSTTSATGATTTTTRPTTTTTSAGSSVTTATTSSVLGTSTPRTGSNVGPTILIALLLAVLGRMAILIARPSMNGDHVS